MNEANASGRSLRRQEERQIARLAAELRARGIERADVAVVLGSGLGAVAERLGETQVVPFEELECMPKSSVPGHSGRFVLGTLGRRRVLVQQGRVHLYEGHAPFEVTRSIRALAQLGVRELVLTNAAGGLHADWEAGSLMLVRDHLNLQGRTALFPHERAKGLPYDEVLNQRLVRAAHECGETLRFGVYAGLLGPAYETAAEIAMLSKLGADAVGMSTVAEAEVARVLGLAVCAVSCITNPAAGVRPGALEHAEVLSVGTEAAPRLVDLLSTSLVSCNL